MRRVRPLARLIHMRLEWFWRSALFLALWALGSCASEQPPDLRGKWTYTGRLQALDETVECRTIDEFAADGSYISRSEARLRNGIEVTAIDTGTWALDPDGRKLTLRVEDSQWQFQGGTTAQQEAQEAHFLAIRKEHIEQANAHSPYVLRWIDKDTISYSIGDSTYVQRRVR